MSKRIKYPFTDFVSAWCWLYEHPYYYDPHAKKYGYHFSTFKMNLDIDVVKVNPKNNRISDDKTKNTKTQVWLETGQFLDEDESNGGPHSTHDIDLDCGSDTFEKAIVKLAKLMYRKHGSYIPE